MNGLCNIVEMTLANLIRSMCLYYMYMQWDIIQGGSLLFLEKWAKGKFQPQKVPMNISERNEAKAMHRITFRASNSVNE